MRRRFQGSSLLRLNPSERSEEREVIKGTSQRVIILRPRDDELFSEIIFILKSSAPGGVDERALLEQAKGAAAACAARYVRQRPGRLPGYAVFFICGMAVMLAVMKAISIL